MHCTQILNAVELVKSRIVCYKGLPVGSGSRVWFCIERNDLLVPHSSLRAKFCLPDLLCLTKVELYPWVLVGRRGEMVCFKPERFGIQLQSQSSM